MFYDFLFSHCIFTVALSFNLQLGTGGTQKDFCVQVLMITYLYGMKTLDLNNLMLKSKPLVVHIFLRSWFI